MKKYYIALTGSIIVLAILGLILEENKTNKNHYFAQLPANSKLDLPPLSPASHISTSTPLLSKALADDVVTELKWVNTPINFWGKAVDENGNPVVGAQIYFVAADKTMDKLMRNEGSKYEASSDVDGSFSLTGVKGAGLYVEVSKEGYYSTDQSAYQIGYGLPTEHLPPSSDNPSVFVLRKMGNTEPLKVYSSGGIRVPKNGQPVRLSLTGGHPSIGSKDVVQIEVWTQDQQKDSQGRYLWRCQISVPNGGLVERDNAKTFIAPESGYKMSDSVNMNPALEQWSARIDREYYVKLSDGTFGRIKLGVRTGGGHYVVVNSFYNPSGSRNLEYGPTKTLLNR